MMKRIILFVSGISALVGVFFLIGFAYYLMSPARMKGHDQVFLVSQGSTLKEVSGKLEREGLITSKGLFVLWARLRGYTRNIKAGEYLLSPAMPPVKILDMLRKGAIKTHPVTIPEGFTRKQIGGLLEQKGIVDKDKFLSVTQGRDITMLYGVSGADLEGYLYPDTYRFSLGMSPMSIIDVMVRRFLEVVGPFREMVEKSGMTMEEVVTLASIIEKETARAEERPLIASVFLNRLKKGMRLESDPTVIYGIKDFKGNLTRKHLKEHTPYNTYVIRRLPPGPIANPGIEAIKAVLSPADTDYVYFVSKNNGTHYFSRTLKEHNRAVYTYQKKRRTRHKKSKGDIQ